MLRSLPVILFNTYSISLLWLKVNEKLYAVHKVSNRYDVMNNNKNTSRKLGANSEELAVQHLENEGYKILFRNYRHQKAEIDIIAQKDNHLCFMEVKARTNLQFGYPETFVKSYQKKRIKEAAENYIRTFHWHNSIRFDIISVVQQENATEIVHFEDAFT